MISVGSEVQILPGPPTVVGLRSSVFGPGRQASEFDDRRPATGRGLSSAGRAPALQAGGHRFDPDSLHQMRWPFEGGASQQKFFASLFQERSKAFFSEEKKQKTFVHWFSGYHGEVSGSARARSPRERGRLVLLPFGACAPGFGLGVSAVFFFTVNQVLVRLWACRGQPSLTGCMGAAMCPSPRPRYDAFRGVVKS